VNIRHSRFQPSSFTVEAGTSVRFVVRNSDPIDHEFIVGGPHIQHKHEIGTHQSHGAIPGEISIPAGTTRATTYEFEEPGTVLVGCHLPGHYEFGMKGRITVVP
jgi:uncharacterized cupredoxin-like copper-binding protein